MGEAPQVTFLPDGQAAVDAVERQVPDLLVLDINMPRMDGLSALRRLRARHDASELPAVVFSTARDDRDVAAAGELQVRAFLQKPGPFDQFCQAVGTILHHARQAGVGEAPATDLARQGRAWQSPTSRGMPSRRIDFD
jgi:two-component system, OmpR family, response regulator MprA